MKKTRFIVIALAVFLVFATVSCDHEPNTGSTPSTEDGTSYEAPKGIEGAWVVDWDSPDSDSVARIQYFLNTDGTYSVMYLLIDSADESLISIQPFSMEGTYSVYEGVDLLNGYKVIIFSGDFAGSLIYDNATSRMYEAGVNYDPVINYVQDASLHDGFADEVFTEIPSFDKEMKRPKYVAAFSNDQLNIDGTWMAVFSDSSYSELHELVFENGKAWSNTMTLSNSYSSKDVVDGEKTEIDYLTYEEDGSYFLVLRTTESENDEIKHMDSFGEEYSIFEYGGKQYLSSPNSPMLMERIPKSLYTDVMKKSISGSYIGMSEMTSGSLRLGFDGEYSQDGFRVAYTKSLLVEDEEGKYTLTSEELSKEEFYPIYKALYENKTSYTINLTAEEKKAKAYADASDELERAVDEANESAEWKTYINELEYEIAKKYYNTDSSKDKLDAAKTNYESNKVAIATTKEAAIEAADATYEASIAIADAEFTSNKEYDDNRDGLYTEDDPYYIRAFYDVMFDEISSEMAAMEQGTITFKPEHGFEKSFKYYSIVSAEDNGSNILKDLILVDPITEELSWLTTKKSDTSLVF